MLVQPKNRQSQRITPGRNCTNSLVKFYSTSKPNHSEVTIEEIMMEIYRKKKVNKIIQMFHLRYKRNPGYFVPWNHYDDVEDHLKVGAF
jgi:hypothetical protein